MSDKERTKSEGRWSGLHWGWKALAVVLVLFIAYTAFGYLAAPSIIRSKLASSLETALKRPVEVGDVSFNPFSFSIGVDGVSISKDEADGSLISVEAINLEVEHFSVVEWAIVLDYLQLVGPEAHIIYYEDGTYNISDLISREEAGDREGRSDPFPFVLERFSVENGNIVFEDRALDKTHTIEELNLKLPFASTLPEDSAQPLQPSLSARLNGTPLALSGRALPFADPQSAEFEISIDGSELTKYWAYVPLPSAVGLESGTLTANAIIGFEQGENILPRLYFRGDYHFNDVVLSGRDEKELLAFESLSLTLKEIGVFERDIRAESLEVVSPVISLRRNEGGGFNWADFVPETGTNGNDRADANATRTDDAESAQLRLQADSLQVENGRLEFKDLLVAGGFEYALSSINLSAENVDTADEEPARIRAEIGTAETGTVTLDATFGILPLQAQGTVRLSGLSPEDFRPYFAKAMPLEIRSGIINGSLEFTVPEGDPGDFSIDTFALDYTDVMWETAGAEEPQFSMSRLDVTGGPFSPAKKVLKIEEFAAQNATIRMQQDRDGEIDVIQAFAGSGENAEEQPDREAGEAEDEEGEPWDIGVRAIRIEGSSFIYASEASPRPGKIELTDLNAELEDYLPEEGHQSPLTVSGRLAGGGRLSLKGSLTLPSIIEGEFKAEQVALEFLQMYIPQDSNLVVAGGVLEAEGGLSLLQGDKAFNYSGAANIDGLLLKESESGERILAVERIEAQGLETGAAPFALAIEQLNLKAPDGLYISSKEGGSNMSRAMKGFGGGDGDEQEGGPADLSIAGINIQEGKIRYVDNTVEPAFDTLLDRMNASIDGIDLAAGEKSNVKLDARIGGNSPVRVEGTLNIMKAGAATHVQLNLENVELPPLSPYSKKYLGYPILKGKLYADSDLAIEKEQLNAQNNFRIENLELGDKIESEDSGGPPVKTALSLLTDSSGTINLNVPVQGDLNDPKFSLGQVIFKAVGGLFGKIVTAPFSILGAIFGGGDKHEEIGMLAFEPGRTELDSTHRQKLTTVAKILSDRPKVELEVAGYVDPEADARALRRNRVRNMVRERKMREMGADAPASASEVELSEQEYPEYLARVYEELTGNDPDGMQVSRMEAALAENAEITEADLRSLARSRSASARNFLTRDQGVDSGRIFIMEHDYTAAPEQEGAARPRVQLGLSG